ncbi:MAG: 6-phosphofructokinase [Gammaproteobacteria bacterium]
MKPKNILYAQSGGVTAVINATAAGVIEAARAAGHKVGHVYAARNGILGVLNEDLIDTSFESKIAIQALRYTPGGAFGSCRYKLKDIETHPEEYERLMAVFKAHDIDVFMYNGGGDSADTAYKISQLGKKMGYPLQCIGIPKTIDNDLPITDTCPGFGSVAKYVATSIREASYDIASMCSSSTQVFIMEVMGRHAGWIAAAAGLARTHEKEGPHIILFPERHFNEATFLNKVADCVKKYGFCSIVVSEGVRNAEGQFLSETGLKDAFGHAQLGGVAPTLAALIKEKLGFKYHWAVLDYLQRSARHLASETDAEQAYAVGKAALEYALAGKNAVMPVIERQSNIPYMWGIKEANLVDMANKEKHMPADYIAQDGFSITQACRDYLEPLIQGEDYPPYVNGLPDYRHLRNEPVIKKLKAFEA